MSWSSESVMVPCPNCNGQLVAEVTIDDYELKWADDWGPNEQELANVNFSITLTGMEPNND
jgi:hypothetical protein